LGVTYYEERKYKQALALFQASREIVDDCPLTLWNLAGTLDAIGRHSEALQFFAWLCESRTSPDDDPCWENKEWAESLRNDCIYRMGICFQNLGNKKEAERLYRQYLDLLLVGAHGIYSVDEVTRRIRGLHDKGEQAAMENHVRKSVSAAIRASGSTRKSLRRGLPPTFDTGDLSIGVRAASKK
jgi:tetratricopeptide (TPR) repeat protein